MKAISEEDAVVSALCNWLENQQVEHGNGACAMATLLGRMMHDVPKAKRNKAVKAIMQIIIDEAWQ